MDIKPLSEEVISKIRSTSNVNNLTHCVTELVLNSLDAKSSAVAIRLNTAVFRIQVVDNGFGISQENLGKIAQKYSTSKCQNLSDLEKKPKSYGFRGESLWSISNISKICTITSKHTASEGTYSKIINFRKHGKVTLAKNRQSDGTTITIEGFFYYLPVRQKRMKKEFEIEEISNFLKCMSIIHPQISFTLRDDISGKLLFKRPKSDNVLKSFTGLYPDIKYEDTIVMKVRKDKISIEALLLKEIVTDKSFQHIFVNKRPVRHSKLQAFICKELFKNVTKIQSIKNLHPTFLINIKCPLSIYSIIYENSEAKVEFLNIDLILNCLEKLILNFLGKSKPIQEIKKVSEKRKSICGVSDLEGAVKGFGFKNWLQRNECNKEKSCEDEIEQSLSQIKPLKHTSKKQSCEKDKLKSLPIKICKQKNEKSTIGGMKEVEKQKKDGIIKSEEETCHKKNEIFVPACNEGIPDKVMIENFHRLEKNCKDIISKKIPEETLFSNFTTTEEKGKDFLMYMFLKSTEIFRGDTQEQPTEVPEDDGKFNTSIETIMESNIFFENITKTKTHQLNENISVSVRLKRRKKSESNFSDKFSFLIPKHNKRKAEYLGEKDRHQPKKQNISLMSPYFNMAKKLDDNNNLEKKIFKQQGLMKTCNFSINDDMRQNFLFTGQQNDQNFKFNLCSSKINNSRYIENNNIKKCFDELSKGNCCFLNLTRKGLLTDYNKSYIFNFENVGELNKELFDERPQTGKDPRKRLALKECIVDGLSGNFDFKNLPFSPIPKLSIPQKNLMKNEKQNEMPKSTLVNLTERKKTTWRKYVSDGDFRETSSPLFTKQKLKYERKYCDNRSFTLENILEEKCPNKIFKKFHTEPFDRTKLQNIQRMKQNIDKLFLNSKLNKSPCYKAQEEVIFQIEKNKTKEYTKDSLERDEKDKQKSRSPLWKKFMKKKSELNNNLKERSPVKAGKKDFFNALEVMNVHFDKTTHPNRENIGESPDLFSGVMIDKPWNGLFGNPENDLTFLPNSAISFDIDDKNIIDDKIVEDGELRTLTAVGTAMSSNLIITLDDEDTKMKTVDVDTNLADGNVSLYDDEWIQKTNLEGNVFYFNKRTGMTSFLHPTKEDIYILKERMEFLPKGLSPILIPDQKLEKSLSPTSKKKLQDEILKSYVDDLGLVKWEKCFKGCDPKKFFDNLYRKRVNEYEKEVPNLKTRMSKFAIQTSHNHKFSKMVLKDLKVIGQIDRKFIAAIDERKFQLILFDQHAVHERIRLEALLKEYEGKSSTCEKVTLFMNQTDVELVGKHKKYLDDIGIHFNLLKNGITVHKIPSCFLNKITKECPLPKLLQLFIREILDHVKHTRGVLTGLPKMMNEIINMEACRGSIKFGEILSQDDMKKLIEELSKCILPFQCAHGRPTLVPLITFDDTFREKIEKPNLRSLKLS
ncbi:DNA mismatch repair protein Mlh3-like [Harmonia axyridis]|uniref:DNA mismatch repair protein Mlh3-like n=1 Tax=Harmonia axyridis TaxID=115357 RepID=UPI001E275F0E|nr:DNA mismatch repair protein Mlh3-like [Harmonia axyridis]